MTREILAVVDMGVLLADQAFYGIGVPRGASDLPTIRYENALADSIIVLIVQVVL
jgi:hypothetical protein